MLESVPGEAVALVVGIDHYAYGHEWSLAGPARDATRYVDWLTGIGVKPANVTLFLSKESWADDTEIKVWAATVDWPKSQRRNAERDEICRFVDSELPNIKRVKALFIYWGGHGVIDDAQPINYLYTADAKDGLPYCISAQDLKRALLGPKFRHLKEQIGVFDSCANPYSDSQERMRPSAGSLTFANTLEWETKQYFMFAASAGKLAANPRERRSGLFSDALLTQLHQADPRSWPNFHKAFRETLGGVERLQLGIQQPYIEVALPGEGLMRFGRPPGQSHLSASLLPLVRATGLSKARLSQLYLASHSDVARGLLNASIEAMLRDLEDARSRSSDHPRPIVEFAERLARISSDSDMKHWVLAQTNGNLSSRTLLFELLEAEEEDRPSRYATLFFDVNPENETLEWCLYASDLSLQGALKGEISNFDGSLDAIQACVNLVLQDAVEKSKGSPVVVSFIVPESFLLGGLATMDVKIPTDPKLPPRLRPLGRRHPVTLHWRERATATTQMCSRAVSEWFRASKFVSARIKAGAGVNVMWLDEFASESNPCATATSKLRHPESGAVCVGLGYFKEYWPGASCQEIVNCLDEGVPCFFWFAKESSDGREFREAVALQLAREPASFAPLTIWRLIDSDNHVFTSMRLVWDEPGYLPALGKLEQVRP